MISDCCFWIFDWEEDEFALRSLQKSTITVQQSSILPVEPKNETIPYPGPVQKSATPPPAMA
jgi:hypothetical protein